MSGTVLVTGGNGYIAGFLIRQLVARGWQVRATVRDLARVPKVRAALGIADEGALRFVAADLMRDAGWAEAMAGCTHVAHVASPLGTGGERDRDALIAPARDGTLRVLRAARDAGVRRFVFTSSGAAIAYGHGARTTPYTEADWTDPDAPGLSPYVRSKAVAERAACDWVMREGGDLEFCAICPGAVLGPILGDDWSGSLQVVSRLLSGGIPGLPDFGFGIVDVRDVADLHVRALEAPDMAGERFIACGPFYMLADVGCVLRERLGPAAQRVPTRRLPDWLVRALAIMVPPLRLLTGELGRIRAMDSRHAERVLGWRMRPADDTIEECARALIAAGAVEAPRGSLSAPKSKRAT